MSMLILDCVNLTNGINSIPTFDLSGLLGLSLSDNRIASITKEWFMALKALRYLNLDANLLTRLPGDVFMGIAHTLTTLKLNNNRFTRVPRQSIRKLSRIQSLHLCYNQITKVHARSFNESGTLITLDLSHNKIKDVSARAFVGLKCIIKLDLRYNELITLDERTFLWHSSPTKRRIYLGSNPWLCNCLLKWLRRDYKRKTDLIYSIADVRSIRCYRPDFLSGKSLVKVSMRELTCDHDYYYYYENDYPIQ